MRIQTKITIAAAAFAAACTLAFGFTVFKYFSPNNDGTRDVLEFPFSASDDGRIVSWKMVIENSRGKIVRTIGNKSTLPSKITAGGVIKSLGRAKESVIIPKSVIWDGTMDDGTMAPDGEYFYYISVKDESDNESTTKKYNVFLDNTPPECSVTVPTGEDLIFGEGAKAVFQIKQSGSKEKKWTGTIIDRDGKAVRTLNWDDNKPANFSWDGTDDTGMIVPDGVYNYVLVGEDRAGNLSEERAIKNIIFSAEKPAVNISINGTKYFSVSGKSEKTKIVFDVDIPQPKNANKLVDWSVVISQKDEAAKTVKAIRTYNAKTTGKAVPPETIEFDAKDDSGSLIAEGEYFATVKARYLNGFETIPVNTSLFTFDTTPLYAKIDSSTNIFSPDGDGRKDIITFSIASDQKGGSPVNFWKGIIKNKQDGSEVKKYEFGLFVPEQLNWDGLNDDGKLCADGKYEFTVSGSDMAGNFTSVKTDEDFVLDTSKTEVLLATDYTYISPDAVSQNAVTFTPVVKENADVVKYNFEIKNSSGQIVFSQKAQGRVPSSIVWNGKTPDKKVLKDGTYSALLTTESANGSVAKALVPQLVIDTVAPSADLSLENRVFSPDNDGRKDELLIYSKNCSKEKLWTVVITDKGGKPVKEYKFNKYINNSVSSVIKWDATDEAGNKVADGTYSVAVKSVDEAGNKFNSALPSVTVDTRPVKVYVTAEYEGFSPLSTNGVKAQKFNLRTSVPEGIKFWEFDVIDEKGNSVYTVQSDDKNKSLPKEIIWNGTKDDGTYADGIFYGELSMEYEKGNDVYEKTTQFVCSNSAPKLNVVTTPEFFSPDNDGTDDDLFIKLSARCAGKITSWSFTILNPDESGRAGKPFWKTSGTSKITEQITWNGLSNVSTEKNGQAERVQSAMDYPWQFTVTDSLGLTSTVTGKISVDILVIRDGNVLKMAVPAIIFRSNAADFKTAKEAPGSKVTPEQAANNERVLKRVAEILKKFPDYTITIVGHANNITGTEAEETSGDIPLVPLSQNRAAFVKTKLESYGIESSRMKTEGKGGRERIASLKDTENWWKNRRVEFLLHK